MNNKQLIQMMAVGEEETLDQSSILFTRKQHEGKIKSIYNSYYSNPQLYVFIPTFIISILLVALMITQVFISGYSVYVGRIACIYILYRYLNLAFSNPGLAREKPIQVLENHRFCTICNIPVRKFTRHCNICDVCVEGYDHHCIFIGKCIGQGNLGQFQEFLCLIFLVMIYALVISVVMAGESSSIQHVGTPNLKPT